MQHWVRHLFGFYQNERLPVKSIIIFYQYQDLSPLQLLGFFSDIRKQCKKLRRRGQERRIMSNNEMMQLHELAICVIGMSFELFLNFICFCLFLLKIVSLSSHCVKQISNT